MCHFSLLSTTVNSSSSSTNAISCVSNAAAVVHHSISTSITCTDHTVATINSSSWCHAITVATAAHCAAVKLMLMHSTTLCATSSSSSSSSSSSVCACSTAVNSCSQC